MRSCIYCGRELEKGEQCNCAQSVRARAAKTGANKSESDYEKYKRSQTSGDTSGGAYSGATAYHTGYTKKQTKRERGSFRRKAKMNGDKAKASAREIKNDITYIIRNILLHPMDAVANPGYTSKAVIIAVNVLIGTAMSFIEYLIMLTRCGREEFLIRLLGYGYPSGAAVPAFIITNAAVFTAMTFVFQLVIYAVDRFILRNKNSFWDFCTRLTAALVPLLVLSVLGAIVGIFTVYATIMLVATGAALSCILLYEALRNQWIRLPRSIVFYITGICIFIFTMICFNIFRILL